MARDTLEHLTGGHRERNLGQGLVIQNGDDVLITQTQGCVDRNTKQEAHILIVLIHNIRNGRNNQVKGRRASGDLEGRPLTEGVVFAFNRNT